MSTFQIIMVVLMSICVAVMLGFAIAFVIEACKEGKVAKEEKSGEVETEPVLHEYDIREMLAQLEEENANAAEQEPAKEEEPAQEEVAVEEVANEQPAEEPVAEEPAVVEEVKEEVEESPAAEETDEGDDEDEGEEGGELPSEGEDDVEPKKNKTVLIKEVTTETVGTDFDYNVRLAKIVSSKNKLEKDMQKVKRAILKYERTNRRRARNQKMLDRKAVELTNLNLLMYSVTDIKNVDADKKAKQEELTTHIAELKASIQDADNFLKANKEKYENDKKVYAFYVKEEARYNDEIKELEILIKNANSVTGSTTTTTTTTTEE